jgi:abortive infection bacteriophage resistance protein
LGPINLSPSRYEKPFLSIDDQLRLIRSRGMEISDSEEATACLKNIGYYRLSGYWYPFRKSHKTFESGRNAVAAEDEFVPGTNFKQVMSLYKFDKRLRMIFLDAIEKVEVALRVDLAILLGNKSPWGHRDPDQFDGRFSRVPNCTGQTQHAKWIARLDDGYRKSKEEFITHFKAKYSGDHPPIWIAIELWDFGALSNLLGGLKRADQEILAARYSLPRPELLTAFARNLNNVRNMCAHHSRLWNRSPADRLAPPKRGEVVLLDHLSEDIHAQSRIYATAAFLQYFLNTISPSTGWKKRLKEHVSTLPTSDSIRLRQAGFPCDWELLPLWS